MASRGLGAVGTVWSGCMRAGTSIWLARRAGSVMQRRLRVLLRGLRAIRLLHAVASTLRRTLG